jgi:glycerate 2-kinase
MNILVCPDSFKGSISAREFCDIAKKVLKNKPHLKVATRPLADGGEHTLDCILPYLKDAEIHWVSTFDPLMRSIKSPYIKVNDVAYIEMAKSSGVILIEDDEKNITHSTSFGTGLVIKDAIINGAKIINLFVGGSATNDGGVGLANALGIDFYSEDGVIASPLPVDILDVTDIESSSHYDDVVFNLITDVNNVLCGSKGASLVYGPQKGGDVDEIHFLDKSLQHLANLLQRSTGKELLNVKGLGAGGGVGACLFALFNTNILPGTETIFNLIGLVQKIRQADLVITGEGCFDAQTLNGKLVDGILNLCLKYNKPSIVIAGNVKLTKTPYNTKIISLKTESMSLEYSIENAAHLLEESFAALQI